MDTQVLKSTISRIEETLNEAFDDAKKSSQGGFIAFLALGDYFDCVDDIESVSNSNLRRSPYVINYVDDLRYDTRRVSFLAHYLQSHYKEGGFLYENEAGIDCISTELMIYSHIWESYFFLKALVRLSQLASKGVYLWDVVIPDVGKYDFINEKVILPLTEKGIGLGDLVRKSYSSYLRNSFAHSIYSVNQSNKQIEFFNAKIEVDKKTGKNRESRKYYSISFEEFQLKFFKSAYLSYYLNEVMSYYRDLFLNQIHSIEFIKLPNEQLAGIGVVNEYGENKFQLFNINDIKFSDNLNIDQFELRIDS